MRCIRVVTGLLAVVLPLLSCSSFGLENSETVKVKTILKTTQSWDEVPLVYPLGQAEITGLTIEIAPGAETGWHGHPVPSFGVLLEGTLEVTLKDGKVKRIQAGEALAEVVGTLHNGRNVGKDTVKILVFYAGAVGTPLNFKESGFKGLKLP